MLTIRRTTAEELPLLLDMVEQSRRTMRRNGNMNQWTGGNPKPELFEADIANGNSYVCVDEDGTVKGTFAFICGEDPTYVKIHDGAWLNDKPYGVIHRIASAEGSHGVAKACISWCYSRLPNIRIDTHRDNTIMQHILLRQGFRYCGIIYLADGDERLAYQKAE